MSEMKAVFFMGKDKIEVRRVDVPKIGKEEALIKVKYAGICGTDLSIVAGKHPRAKAPLIMGHEFSRLQYWTQISRFLHRQESEESLGKRLHLA